ncbi:hypothetical protein PN290_02415 [Romboutsia sp. 1001216sp1]|uniref:hypothetical protein n=1 Tax=unclassified Romboutsia TaxID=2626894 RepID=UPI0018AA8981|nr:MULTISPECIES: hypothetical protein [unclassified Romboutsia]MDB8792603.1 hypothetical protein [Romboutsia sp. 1001216sp1]MDB8796230.1 hypothetical protein [Romboutsia sp. 1001216sp1]MDB8798223.1 hypothetical protein [Romboutsia sp. 1001216sp1]
MELITNYNAEIIKDILLNANLDNIIELEYKNIKAKIRIDDVSGYEKSLVFFDRDMKMYNFLNSQNTEDEYSCLEINGRQEVIYINIGEWGLSGNYSYRIKKMHIALGVSTSKFGSAKEYFSQLEISQALEEDKYIYLVKNISDLAGKGAIARLNSGLKDKSSKYERRDRLVKRLNSEIKFFDNKEWMVINKISKEDLNKEKKHNDIFYNMIKDIINYSFTIEDIIAEDKILASAR